MAAPVVGKVTSARVPLADVPGGQRWGGVAHARVAGEAAVVRCVQRFEAPRRLAHVAPACLDLEGVVVVDHGSITGSIID
jgi:hypothetical protein